MKAALVDKLEVWGFEKGLFIFKDLSLGTILKLTPIDISCSNDETLNSLHQLFRDFLNGLPPGLNIQFVQCIERAPHQLFDRHSFVNNTNELIDEVTKERVCQLTKLNESGSIPNQSLYAVIRKPFVKKPKTKKKWWAFGEQDEETDFDANILEPEVQKFTRILQSIMTGLQTIGVNSQLLDEDESFALLFDQFNPNYPIKGLNFNKEDIRDELILNDLGISLSGFILGSVHHRVLSLKLMPELTFASMSEKLRLLPFDSKLFLTIEALDQNYETALLQTQRRIAYAMYAGKKGVTDLESAAKLKDLESLLEQRITGEEKIFSASLNVLLRSESEIALEEQVAEVLQTMRELSGAEGMIETIAAAPMFLDFSLPNARCKDRSRRMNTSVLADFLPLFGDWTGHDDPKMLLRNRRGALLSFDPFSSKLTNYNQIVSGGSGAGKSFFTNILVTSVLKNDPKVFILDIGGSYQKLCNNFNGQYIPLGADSNLSMNPFDLLDKTPESMDQKIKFIVSLVEMMTKETDATGIGKLERSEIEIAVQELYRESDSTNISALKEKLLKNVEPSVQRIGKILTPWCGNSPYGKFIDRATNLELKSKIVCFDLKGLDSQPELQSICLFLITDLIWREVQRDRINDKYVVFDECWKLLENDAGSRFIGEVFRTFRKYRASAIAISQTMDDFAKSKVSSAILPNAAIKWILKQTGGNLNTLQEVLQLNEREAKLVESIKSKKGFYSEAFLVAGDDRQVVVIESTPLEYWIATSDPSDLRLINQEKFNNPEATNLEVLQTLAFKFPNGASSAQQQRS